MSKTRLNFDINFRTRGNFGPLSQGLNQVRAQSTAAFGAMTTPAIRTKSAIDQLSSSLDRKRLSLTQTRVALRNTSAILKEHNALVNASAVSYKNAAGAGKTYLTINRAMTASTVSLNMRLRYTATVLNAASTSLINFGKNVQWAGRQVMMGLTLPLLLIGSAASKAAEDLDRQLVRIVKVTNVSTYKLANQFGELGESMRSAFDVGDSSDDMVERVSMMGNLIRKESMRMVEFGASMGFIAEQTGKVSAEFAQMGFQGFALSALTKQATILSRVSGSELNESVQLVRLTVQAFGQDIADLEENFARLNLIENNTALSLAEMAQGIPIVASVANNLGISIENLAGMLAVMKEKGIAAREGATALRTGLIQLIQKPTRSAVEAFELINVNLNEMQERNRGDIIGFFNELANTMDDLSGSGQKGQANLEMFTQALATLTGVRASARFLSLISEMGDLEKVFDEETQKNVWSVKEGVDANSVAARAFINTIYDAEQAIAIYRFELDQVNNSLSGVRDRLKAELNVELAKMGTAFLRVGNSVREALNNVLRSFNSLSERTQNIIFSFGTFIAVLGPVTMFMGIFANALGQIAKGVTSLLPKMKLMTAAQVAESRAQEISNKGLAISLAMKEEMIGTNMRLMASAHALNTATVLSAHGMFGLAPLPMSIRPGASAAQKRSAARGVLPRSDARALSLYEGLVASGKSTAGMTPPSTALVQSGRSSRVAGTAAAAAVLSPALLKMFPGVDLGLMGTPLSGGTGSIAQLLQQQVEKDLLETRNSLIRSGAIGGPNARGVVLDNQFGKHLKAIKYDPQRRAQEIMMLAGQTGTLAGQQVDPSFLRAASGMAPALMAGTVVSGQAVRGGISPKTKLNSKAMANVIHNERLFRLAEMQKSRAPVVDQLASQTKLLKQEAAALRLSGTAADDYVRSNMPRTLPAPSAPVSPRQAPTASQRPMPAARVPTVIPRPPAPAPAPAPAAPPAATTPPSRRVRNRPSLLQIKSRKGGLAGRGMELQDSPLARYTRSPIGRVGTGRAITAAATGAAAVASGAARAGSTLVRGALRAETIISDGLLKASDSVSRNIRNAGSAAGASIANTVSPAYTRAANAAGRGRARIGHAAAMAGSGIMARGRGTASRVRASAFRGMEGVMGTTGGLPQAVSRSALAASREAALVSEFAQLEQMGRVPDGMTQQQYVGTGMKKHQGVKGKVGAFRSALKGTQGAQTTGMLRGVERGSNSGRYIRQAATAAMVMPLTAPFKVIGKLGTMAGKGLQAVAKSGGILGKVLGPLAKVIPAVGGKLAVAGGVALGAAAQLALPLIIVFGALAMTNKDEFMKGLMSTLQGPLDRLKSAWDQLTKRFEYIMFLFRNLRGDGEGAFAGIARMVGRLAGWVGGILADAFTSVMTAIQVIFKAVEFLLKLFSRDFTGAIDALKDAFKLLGIFVLEIFLNIADTLLGWIPLLGRIIGRGKDVVAGWRESITALDEVQKYLVEVDKTIRSLGKNSSEWQEGLDETEASVRRMAELEIFPMDLVDDLLESVKGFEFDPFGDFESQVDEIARTIAEMEGPLGRLPPQVQDLIMSLVEQTVVVNATNELLEEQERIKDRLLGLTDNLTEKEVDELNLLREQTDAMENHAKVLNAVLDGDGKSEGLFTKNWSDEMKDAAEELVQAGLLFKTEGGLIASDKFFAGTDDQAARIEDYLNNFNRLSNDRLELEERTTKGMNDQIQALEREIAAKETQLETNRALIATGTEEEIEGIALVARLEQELADLRAEHGGLNKLLEENRLSASQLATNQIMFEEKQRHIEALRNAKIEAESRLKGMTSGTPEAIRQASHVRSISVAIAKSEGELNKIRADGIVLTGEQRDSMSKLLESIENARREFSEALATRRGMQGDDPANDLDDSKTEASSAASSFRSAMSEVMSDIANVFNRVLSEQAKKISDHFSDLKSVTKDYFSDYADNLAEQTKQIIDQLDQRAQAEEDAINAVADLRVEAIDDQAKKERELDDLRERFFRREQARLDFVKSRATADINIKEALLRGERGRAAILRIEKEVAVQEYYNTVLRDREEDIRALRDAAREQQIDSIELEREEALKANKERVDIEKIAVNEAEKRAKEAAKIAEERAEKEIEMAEKAAEEAMEMEQYRIEQYLREWQKITPATEEEFKKHLGELQRFFDQSNNRLRSEINKIYGDFSVVFNSMSKDFQNTNNSLMSELRTRLGAVEDQYIGMNNTILGAIHNTNVEVANSVDDILASIGTSGTATEKILGDARDAFKTSVGDMLNSLTMASGDTLLEFTENFIPDFTGNMDWAFSSVNEMGKEFSKVFGSDLEKGFRTAIDRAIAALTEEQKWKDAESKIAAYMANIAKHLNITIPGPPGPGSDPKPDPGDTNDPHPFPGDLSVGSRGDGVKKVQKALNSILRERGMATISEDGIFGPQTGSAVLAVKQRIGYPLGGGHTVNEKFWNALKPRFHQGGYVGGSRSDRAGAGVGADEISAVLQKGEYVINRRATSVLGTDLLDRINSVQARFSSPRAASGSLRGTSSGSSSSTSNTYNLSFNVDGGNIDEQMLAQKVVFEIKKMERNVGGGRRMGY